ncbi:MAG: sulfotransferase [Cytophagales bacterium]|nr:sulfotransferase [Cytophagales bacterium]
MKKRRAIQIIGTQRSGSNLLRLMLNQLEEVVAPHPPHILKAFMNLLPAYGNLSAPRSFRNLIADVCRFVEANPVPWQEIVLDWDRIANLCKENTLIELFRVIYEIKAEANGAEFWCCKSMHNVYYADLMESIRPFYIHLVRDGRDVAASFRKTVVGEMHPYFIGRQWKKDQEFSNRLIEKIGRERAIRIHYEDLIEHPEDVMKSICRLLNVTYDTKVLDFYNSKESNLTAVAGKMWSNLKKPIIRDNTKKYKSELTAEEIRIFESVAAGILTEYGYEPDHFNNSHAVYSSGQIKMFESENRVLKKKMESELKEDVVKRFKQREIITKIASRIPKPT